MSEVQHLPEYVCHKKVRAFKILRVEWLGDTEPPPNNNPAAKLVPETPGLEGVTVNGGFIRKHRPKAGGYFVAYEDGYQSYSPAEAFENGYTLIGKNPA